MKDKIKAYITSSLIDSEVELKYDDDILNTGLVDSIGVIKLITFIEEEFGLKVPPEEMVIENFISVAAIERFLESIK